MAIKRDWMYKIFNDSTIKYMIRICQIKLNYIKMSIDNIKSSRAQLISEFRLKCINAIRLITNKNTTKLGFSTLASLMKNPIYNDDVFNIVKRSVMSSTVDSFGNYMWNNYITYSSKSLPSLFYLKSNTREYFDPELFRFMDIENLSIASYIDEKSTLEFLSAYGIKNLFSWDTMNIYDYTNRFNNIKIYTLYATYDDFNPSNTIYVPSNIDKFKIVVFDDLSYNKLSIDGHDDLHISLNVNYLIQFNHISCNRIWLYLRDVVMDWVTLMDYVDYCLCHCDVKYIDIVVNKTIFLHSKHIDDNTDRICLHGGRVNIDFD